jgi:CHAT domain-containing protein/tetratricopeptide (TPR) repeat protein
MQKFMLFFGIGFFWNFAISQSSLPKNEIDSLWSAWTNPSQPDTLRLQAIQRISWYGYIYSQPDSAFYFSQLQFDFAEKKGLKKQMAAARYVQGVSYFFRGDYIRTVAYYSQSLKIQEEIGDKRGIANCLSAIAVLHDSQGNYSAALDYGLRSLKMQEEIGDKGGIASSLGNIAVVYQNQGDYAIAFEYYMQSLKINEALGHKKGIAAFLNNIGILYNLQGDYARSIDYHQQSLQLEEELGNKHSAAKVLSNIGNIYRLRGDFVNAIAYSTRSLKMQEELDDKAGSSSSLMNIGLIYEEKGDYLAALELYTQSLIQKEEIGDKQGMVNALIGLATLHEHLGNVQKSISYGLSALSLATEIGVRNGIKDASRGLFTAYLQTNKLDSSLFYLSALKNAVGREIGANYFSLSEREKELYFATMEEDFGRYYDYTLFHHTDFPALSDTAYNLALTNKGLSLKSSSSMRLSILNSEDSVLISEYNEWIQLKRKIADLYFNGNDTRELENEANELEKELVKKSRAFSDFDKLKNLDWKKIQASLRPDECAIEFVHFKSEIDSLHPVIYMALLVKPGSTHPEIIRLCNQSDLIEILGTFQGNNLGFVNAVYGTREAAQTALYQKVWLPLENYLDGVKTVYYSPSGLLHKISFGSISKSQNVFLSDLYNFRQTGSTGTVALPEDITFGELENFLLMGGVNYNSANSTKEAWSYLPGSLQETESIHSFLTRKKFGVNYFYSNNASEEIFKEKIGSSTIVHIATHGFFFPDPDKVREEMKAGSESNQDLKFRGSTNYANWSFVNNKNPLMRSGIVLAGANDVWERDALTEGEDGILTAQEVSNIDLRNTKLVVLSACETGLGDIKGSEGVYGLQRAFKMAGVKYLIMSLWQVPDKETAEFMQCFYKNLLKLKDIPKAFQKTQKVMRQKYDPYYWAAFVLIE